MPLFKEKNIDTAIEKTKLYLKGFKEDSNILYVSGLEFLNLAIGGLNDISYLETSYEEYLTSVQELYTSCTEEQKKEIEEIILYIVRESKKAKLKPIEKDNFWGKVILAFLESFKISTETTAQQ